MAKVTLDTDDDVGVLSLTNPPLNLWDKGLLADWKSAIDQAARTPKRALVVRAEGSIFSGGTIERGFCFLFFSPPGAMN